MLQCWYGLVWHMIDRTLLPDDSHLTLGNKWWSVITIIPYNLHPTKAYNTFGDSKEAEIMRLEREDN